ncbi:MAG: 3-dehydroquinate synthase, partial [Clostridia bacterium]|nr:3-dehydroquinate synthase [Clostridia bacterium]
FGHSYGLAIVKYFKFSGYSHGQGVGIGMAFFSAIRVKLGQSEKGTTARIVKILKQYGLPTEDKVEVKEVMNAILNDKKNFGKKLHVVLLKRIGESFTYPTNAEYFLN